jgi:short-subunit dehydrogenase
MLARRCGHIVLVTSMDGKKGLPLDAPYVSAKFALSGYGDVLCQELRGTGVHSTVVYPGRVDTAMIEKIKVHWIQPKASVDSVVRAILAGIRRRKPEVLTPPHVALLPLANIVSPHLANWFIRFFRLEGWD